MTHYIRDSDHFEVSQVCMSYPFLIVKTDLKCKRLRKNRQSPYSIEEL